MINPVGVHSFSVSSYYIGVIHTKGKAVFPVISLSNGNRQLIVGLKPDILVMRYHIDETKTAEKYICRRQEH